MVPMGLSMKFWTPLIYGWSFERDPATSNYMYGTVPYYVVEHYSLMKFYLKKSASSLFKKPLNKIKTSFLSFTQNFPKTYTACIAAAATIGYFVGIGIAWSVASAILKFMRIF